MKEINEKTIFEEIAQYSIDEGEYLKIPKPILETILAFNIPMVEQQTILKLKTKKQIEDEIFNQKGE